MKPSAFSFQLSALLLALVLSASAQQTTAVQKGGAAGTNNITADLYFPAARELRLSGIFSGTPASGALNLSNLTLTLPAATSGLFQPIDADLTSWASVTRASGFDTFTATPSGANLASLLTTALPASKGGTGLTALGTGVATALGVNTGSAGAFVVYNAALGTPTAGDLSNAALTYRTATTSVRGGTILATTAEALAGTDTAKAIVPAALEARALQGDTSRAVRDSFYFDGVTSGGRIYWPLGTAGAGVGAADRAVLMLLKLPDSVPTTMGLFALSIVNNSSVSGAYKGYHGYLSAGGILIIRLYDGATGSSRFITYAGFTSQLGSTVPVAVVKSAAGAPVIYVSGVPMSGVESTSGPTPPSWSDASSDAYLLAGVQNAAEMYKGGMILPPVLINAALTAAEVLAWAQTGRLPTWCENATGSMVAQTSGTLTAGRKYRITSAGGTFTGVGAADNNVGTEFVATGTTPTWSTGAVITLGPIAKPVVQPIPVVADAGTNKIAGILTSGITPITLGDRGAFTATLTWSGTHEGKSLIGAQAIPSNAIITRIWRKATVASSGSGCTIGTTNSATRWQALDTYTTAAEIVTLANQLPAGTAANDLDIVVDPDTANYTGSITVTVEYQIVGGTP